MSYDDENVATQRLARVNDMLNERSSTRAVQDLCGLRLQPRAFAGRENNARKSCFRHEWLFSLSCCGLAITSSDGVYANENHKRARLKSPCRLRRKNTKRNFLIRNLLARLEDG